jgi:Zn-dependent protease with chaperone function
MKGLKLWAGLLLIFFMVPTAGIIVSNIISNSYQKEYELTILEVIKEKKGIDLSNNHDFLYKMNLNNLCKEKNLDATFSAICNEFNGIKYLNYVSIAILMFTAVILLLISLLGEISRNNRSLLFYIFRPGLVLSQICSVILIAANAGILIFSIYYAELFYLERVHFILLGSVGLIAVIAIWSVLIKTLVPLKSPEMRIFAKILHKDEQPLFWDLIQSVAKHIGTAPPDAIIAGMDTTFFVTEAKIICIDGEICGKTLYVSLPFCSILTKNELSAIIGHEMGHFIGEDTRWTQKFYPIYRGSIETFQTLAFSSSENGLAQLAFLPALYLMLHFVNSFQKSEKLISRNRELKADKVGANLSSAVIFASALLKVHIYQYAWQLTLERMKEVITEDKHIINLSSFFNDICHSLPQNFLESEIGGAKIPHPSDSHPPLSLRLESIGVPLPTLYAAGINLPTSDVAIELVHNSTALEQELSIIEHHKLVQSGAVKVHTNTDQNQLHDE